MVSSGHSVRCRYPSGSIISALQSCLLDGLGRSVVPYRVHVLFSEIIAQYLGQASPSPENAALHGSLLHFQDLCGLSVGEAQQVAEYYGDPEILLQRKQSFLYLTGQPVACRVASALHPRRVAIPLCGGKVLQPFIFFRFIAPLAKVVVCRVDHDTVQPGTELRVFSESSQRGECLDEGILGYVRGAPGVT